MRRPGEAGVVVTRTRDPGTTCESRGVASSSKSSLKQNKHSECTSHVPLRLAESLCRKTQVAAGLPNMYEP